MSSNKDYEYSLPSDIFYTTKEIIDTYGEQYSFFINDTLLVKNREVYKSYIEDDLVEITKLGKKVSVSKNLLFDLLDDNGMYKYILAHMDNPHGIAVKIALFENGDITKSLTLTRAEFSELLNQINSKELTPTQQMRKSLINNLSTDYSLKQKYKNKIHKSNIDGKEIEVSASLLLEILALDKEEFAQFIAGVKKYQYSNDVIAYLLVDFIQRERILEKYIIPDVQLNRYKSIESLELIDFEYINKNQKSNDYDSDGNSLVDQVTINNELYNSIIDFLNPEYSPLEKAIYIYIKMCELLTYDPSFYAANQKGEEKYKHENIKHIESITLKNNEVVCYEFIMIYAKFLKELDIDFTIDSALLFAYGGGHAQLTFRYAEYLVAADSVRSIIENDMANIKINAPLKGLRCFNSNLTTRKKFEELFYKIMTNYIKQKEDKKMFEDSLLEYKSKYANVRLDTKEKLQILLKELARKDLKGMDTISYQKRIFKNVFESLGSVTINFISSSINTRNNSPYTPITIVTILTMDGYKYLSIDPNSPDVIESISERELEEMFECGYYAYINNSDKKIPGLELKGGKSYVR